MLGSADFDMLAAWFVESGFFGEMLMKWEQDDRSAG